MAKQVAVYVDKSGQTASLYEPGQIILYQKRQGQWTIIREKTFTLEQNLSLRELRQKMAEAIIFLEQCKVFVGLSIVGVPYFELEKAGCSVWEFAGRPLEFLDYIVAQEEATDNQTVTSAPVPAPIETANGCYKISLKEIQQNNSSLTSKQVLQPFLRQNQFYELEIICSHIPPWLEAEMMAGNWQITSEKISPNEIKLLISKKTCHDC